MADSHSAWYQALDPDKKAAIRELHTLNRYWNLVGLLFFLIWGVTAYLMLHFNTWTVLVPGYVLIGLMIHSLANFMHEGIHGSLFRNRRWDRYIGFVMGAPSMFTLSAYGVNHLMHHKNTRTEHDPDEFTNVSKNPRVQSIFFYVFFLFGMFLYGVRVPIIAWRNGTPRQRREIAQERLVHSILLVAIIGTTLYYGCFMAVVHVWFIPLCFTVLFGNIQAWAEHPLTSAGNPLTETRTVTSNRLFSFLNINLNYHIEHHLFPGVPWYNLPKVHRILLDDYRAAGASVYRSYFVFLFDAFRLGIHGLTPVRAIAPAAQQSVEQPIA